MRQEKRGKKARGREKGIGIGKEKKRGKRGEKKRQETESPHEDGRGRKRTQDPAAGSSEEAVAVRVQIYSGFRWPLSFANMTPMHTRGVRRI